MFHMYCDQLFIHTNDGAIHALFIVSSGVPQVMLTGGNGGADGNVSLIVPWRTPEIDLAAKESSRTI